VGNLTDLLKVGIFLPAVLVLLTAAIYFYSFRKMSGKFMLYWGLSWLFSSAGYICTLLILRGENELMGLELLKKAGDMYALLFLLFAAYDFAHKPVAIFWLRYSFLLLLLSIVLAQYPLVSEIILLPISAYQGILTVVLCYAVAVKWTATWAERGTALAIFLLIGAVKALFPYNFGEMYLYEILLFSLMNFYVMYLFLERTYRSFSEKESEYRLLAENATDIIFDYHLKPAPYFAFVSPAVEALTGYHQKEFYKNANLFEELTVHSDRQSLRDLFKAQDQGIQAVQWQKKNGDYIWVEFHNSPVLEQEEILSVEGIIRDVTERKLVEEELIRSRKAQQIFFSSISHELKTPVTSILGYAKALEGNVLEGSEKHREAISLISSKSFMLQRLIEDLIQLSKLESHQFSFQFVEVDVVLFFKGMADKQSAVVATGKQHFEAFVSPQLRGKGFKFIADVERMEQVFDNLVNNAVKFTPPRGKIRISCSFDASCEKVVFEVEDTGRGIPAESLPFIFETYYKDERAKKDNPEGRGLGLSIVKEIVKGHQGDIFAESREGKGSKFTITVPIYEGGDGGDHE